MFTGDPLADFERFQHHILLLWFGVIIPVIVAWFFLASITRRRAEAKNRGGLLWGWLALQIPVLPLIYLAFAKFKCADCGNKITNAQHQEKACPHCTRAMESTLA